MKSPVLVAAVRMQFLGEAVMLTVFGGLLGIASGVAACFSLGRVLQWSMVVPADAIAVAALISAIVGVSFGF